MRRARATTKLSSWVTEREEKRVIEMILCKNSSFVSRMMSDFVTKEIHSLKIYTNYLEFCWWPEGTFIARHSCLGFPRVWVFDAYQKLLGAMHGRGHDHGWVRPFVSAVPRKLCFALHEYEDHVIMYYSLEDENKDVAEKDDTVVKIGNRAMNDQVVPCIALHSRNKYDIVDKIDIEDAVFHCIEDLYAESFQAPWPKTKR